MFLFLFGCKIPAQSSRSTRGIRMIARQGRDASLSAVWVEESSYKNAAYKKIPHRKPVRDCVLQGAGMSLSPMPARSCYSDAELLTKVAANIGLPSNSEVTLLPSLSKKACSEMELSSL